MRNLARCCVIAGAGRSITVASWTVHERTHPHSPWNAKPAEPFRSTLDRALRKGSVTAGDQSRSDRSKATASLPPTVTVARPAALTRTTGPVHRLPTLEPWMASQ